MVMQMGTPMQIFPVYNPGSHPAKKEKSRLRSAENAIHLIPLVLLLCAQSAERQNTVAVAAHQPLTQQASRPTVVRHNTDSLTAVYR
uniref:Uncharacterized protein n=1 Tax=Chenopodium quinoa TaxID=63459 RepID=A0A803LUH0_CHEQI